MPRRLRLLSILFSAVCAAARLTAQPADAPVLPLDDLRPEIIPIAAAPERREAVQNYAKLRADFNRRLAEEDPEALRQKWQKWYFRGVQPDGTPGNPLHLSKFRAADPVERVEHADGRGDSLPERP